MNTRIMFNILWFFILLIMLSGMLVFLPGQGPVGSAVRPSAPTTVTRFTTVDVIMETGAVPLAAWQVEFLGSIAGGVVRLVGIEGGEHAAFAHPAYYDPAALVNDNGRVILAAYSTNTRSALPTGKTRIARLHLSINGGADQSAEFRVTLHIAANADGQTIDGARTTVLSTASQNNKGS